MKVLVAEDDRHTREGLREIMVSEGYQVTTASNGAEAIRLFRMTKPDFVCLDIMMPGESGYEVCQTIRAHSPGIPIIFISAKAEEFDRLAAFDVGADDFIVKPFSVREVIARIRAVARRCGTSNRPDAEEFAMGDLLINPAELRARRGDDVIDLSLRDIRILQLLHENRGKALDRSMIFVHAWGDDYFPNSRTLDQHISQLRRRIERDPADPKIVLTVHGVGYRFDG
jgi:DNA-binding response OmpR family regulator